MRVSTKQFLLVPAFQVIFAQFKLLLIYWRVIKLKIHETSKKRREETKIREILNLESIIIRIALVMLLPCDWLRKLAPYILSIKCKTNALLAFSRRFHWLYVVYSLLLIGRHDYSRFCLFGTRK